MAKEKTEFKVLWCQFIKLARLLEKHSRSARPQVWATKRTAYQLAKLVIVLQGEHHNEYYKMVKSGSEEPEQTRRRIFVPLEAIQESTGQLFEWIEEGVTQEQYLLSPPALFATKVTAPKGAASTREAAPSFEQQIGGLDVKDQVRELIGRLKTLEGRNRDLGRKVRKLLHDNAVQAKELSQLHLRIARQLV